LIHYRNQINSSNSFLSKSIKLLYDYNVLSFDFNSQEERDKFVKTLYHKGMICNTAGKLSVRLRPNLAITEEEVVKGCALIKEALKEVK
jgi:4-aminobutyrate aminotransferase-like enzyme